LHLQVAENSIPRNSHDPQEVLTFRWTPTFWQSWSVSEYALLPAPTGFTDTCRLLCWCASASDMGLPASAQSACARPSSASVVPPADSFTAPSLRSVRCIRGCVHSGTGSPPLTAAGLQRRLQFRAQLVRFLGIHQEDLRQYTMWVTPCGYL